MHHQVKVYCNSKRKYAGKVDVEWKMNLIENEMSIEILSITLECGTKIDTSKITPCFNVCPLKHELDSLMPSGIFMCTETYEGNLHFSARRKSL